MPAKHILILTASDYPIPEGLGVRIENLAKAYHNAGHRVTVLAPNLEMRRPKDEHSGFCRIVRVRIPVLGGLLRRRMLVRAYAMLAQTLLSAYVYFRSLRNEKIDIIQAEHVYSIPSAVVIKLFTRSRVFVDDIITVADILKDSGNDIIASLFTLMEKVLFKACDAFIYTSEVSRLYYEQRGARAEIFVPNGVDTEKFSPGEINASGEGLKTFLFNCSAYSGQNIEAARNFLFIGRKLREKVHAGFRFHLICGPEEIIPGDLKREFSLEKDWFTFEDRVPDIVSRIQAADFALLPYNEGHHLTGGIRLKALEYMACGKTMITTPEGVEGIDGIASGTNAIVVDLVEEMVPTALRILEGGVDLRGMALRAREFVVNNYGWNVLVRPMLERLENL